MRKRKPERGGATIDRESTLGRATTDTCATRSACTAARADGRRTTENADTPTDQTHCTHSLATARARQNQTKCRAGLLAENLPGKRKVLGKGAARVERDGSGDQGLLQVRRGEVDRVCKGREYSPARRRCRGETRRTKHAAGLMTPCSQLSCVRGRPGQHRGPHPHPAHEHHIVSIGARQGSTDGTNSNHCCKLDRSRSRRRVT